MISFKRGYCQLERMIVQLNILPSKKVQSLVNIRQADSWIDLKGINDVLNKPGNYFTINPLSFQLVNEGFLYNSGAIFHASSYIFVCFLWPPEREHLLRGIEILFKVLYLTGRLNKLRLSCLLCGQRVTKLVPIHKWLFSASSASDSDFNPRNPDWI